MAILRIEKADELVEVVAYEAVLRLLTLKEFSGWGIPVVGHSSELFDYDAGSDEDEIDHRATIRVDPPGVTKTVRYAYPREGDTEDTRCVVLMGSKQVVPPNKHVTGGSQIPVNVVSGDHIYPAISWPGSVVEVLYTLADELADQFDWTESEIGGRQSIAGFILTGKSPEAQPIEARWVPKTGRRVKAKWRIQLTIPPWLTESEVLGAYRQMRGQVLGRAELPKTATPLEVARFVWEQERLNGYKRPPWPSLLGQWNAEHPPDERFDTYNHLYTYYDRGEKAVKRLNFLRRRSGRKGPLAELTDAMYEALDDKPRLREMSTEKLARHLVHAGYINERPPTQLLEDVLEGIDAAEPILATDELISGEWIRGPRL